MPTPLFKPISCNVEWLISNIDHGNLGLPDIQRPFVWNNTQVRDLFDSMSGGQKLNQSDFILTLMSVFWDEGRSALETFCKDSRVPSDNEVTPYNYFIKPEPSDMLRVVIGLAFKRARLKYGYQVLRGKDLGTGEVTTSLRETHFATFKAAQAKTLNIQNWKDFIRCLYSAGFRSEKMITSHTGLMYAYTFYLVGKYDYALSGDVLRMAIARWFFMTSLTARYSSSPESKMEEDLADLRGIKSGKDFLVHLDRVIKNTLTDDFWNITLPNDLTSAAARSPYLFAYYAALVLQDARVLFSELKVSDMLDQAMRGQREALERHHLFPKAYLKRIGISEDRDRNQIANYALVEWDRNATISDDSPAEYFPIQLAGQADNPALRDGLRLHALPEGWEHMNYKEFLEKRRNLMAQVTRDGFAKLS